MQHYYVSKQAQSNGNHEIHVPRCTYLPEGDNSRYLGAFVNCNDALRAARSEYPKAAGCACCCPACEAG